MESIKKLKTEEGNVINGESALHKNIKIGMKVKIKEINDLSKRRMDPEDYYYLKQFENKTGVIGEIAESLSGLCSCRVDFDERNFGYFYEEDFEVIDK